MFLAPLDPWAPLDRKVSLAHKDLKETLVQLVLLDLRVQPAPKALLVPKDLKETLAQPVLRDRRVQPVLWALSARLDRKVPLVHRDQRETLVQPALLELRVQPVPLVLLEVQAQLVRWDLPARVDRPGRKAPWDRLARLEGLSADVNSRTAALSWCQLESAA